MSSPMIIEKNEELTEGEWVLLFNDRIVDHSANVEDILRLAEEKYPHDKFPPDSVKITKVFSKTPPREVLLNK